MTIESIRARVEAATPGPWVNTVGQVYPVAQVYPPGAEFNAVWPVPQTEPDADFIAHARQDVPLLLAVAEAAAAVRDAESDMDVLDIYDDAEDVARQGEHLRRSWASLRDALAAL